MILVGTKELSPELFPDGKEIQIDDDRSIALFLAADGSNDVLLGFKNGAIGKTILLTQDAAESLFQLLGDHFGLGHEYTL